MPGTRRQIKILYVKKVYVEACRILALPALQFLATNFAN